MKKLFLSCLLACMAVLPTMATDAFRWHRYDMWKVLPVQSNDVVFFGNSITDMHNWQEAFKNSPYRVVNRGNSGGYSYELLANLESVVTGHPAKIFMKIGTNDLGTSCSPESIRDNIQKIVDRVKAESPETEFYIQSILPAKDQAIKTLATIQQTNAMLKAIADADTSGKVFYVNLYDSLGGVRDGGDYSADQLHLKAYGYKIWTDIVAPMIDNGCTSVYPSDTRTAQNMGGLGGANGMRVTYYSCQPIASDDILFVGDEMVKCGEWNELLGTDKIKNRGTGWGYGGDINTINTSINTIMAGYAGSAKPKAVLLYTGTADLNGSTDLNTVLTNYQTIVGKIHTAAPDAKIYLIGNLPTNNATTCANRIAPFNTSLATYANQNSSYITYIDTYTPFVSGGQANTEYLTAGDGGAYLYGLGYAKMAEILQPYVDELTGTTNTGITVSKAKKQKAFVSGRTAVVGVTAGSGIGQFPQAKIDAVNSALTTLNAATTDADITSATAALTTAQNELQQSINVPTQANTDGKQFTICSAQRGNRYLFTDGSTLNGNATNNGTAKYRWTLEYRNDGTVDIKNTANNKYILASAGYNTTITVGDTKPANGWTLSYCNTTGLYIISNGTVELNMTGNSGFPVYNWSNGQTGQDRADTGCQFLIEDVTDVPVVVPTAGVPEFNATSPATLTSGWYQIKWVDTNGDSKSGVASDVAGKFVTNYETNLAVGSDKYPLYLGGTTLANANEAAKTFVYLDRASASVNTAASIKSSNGSYVAIDGKASASASNLYVIYYSSASYPVNSVVCSGTGGTRTSWLPMTNYIGGSSTNKFPMCQFSPVNLESINMKAVSITVTGADEAITYTGTQAYGYKTLGNGATLFVDADATLSASDFNVPEVTGKTKNVTVSGNTVTVTYTGGGVTPTPADNPTVDGSVWRWTNKVESGSMSVETASNTLKWFTTNASDTKQHFLTEVADGGKYYLRSVYNGRYVKGVNANTAWSTVTKDQRESVYFNTNGDYYTPTVTSTSSNNSGANAGANSTVLGYQWAAGNGRSWWTTTNVVVAYDIYDIVVEGTTSASAGVTINGVTPAGATSLGHGEAFFIAAGTEVAASNFTAREVSGLEASVSLADNVITVTYTGGTPASADDLLGDWYNFRIGSSGMIVSYTADNQAITLSTSQTTNADADLWRRVGDDTNGWRVYNKAAGMNKVLAAPTNTADGNTGGNTYPVVVDKDNIPSGYTDLWEFSSSSNVTPEDGSPAFYMNEKGYSSNKVNIRSSKLAFWNGGADAGSTVWFSWAQAVEKVDMTRGALSGGNSAWNSTWTSTKTTPTRVQLVSNANNMQASGNNLDLRSGSALSATYTFRADNGYYVKAFTFDASLIGTNQVITYNGTQTNVTSTPQTIAGNDLGEEDTAVFTLAGPNTGTLFQNAYVTVQKVQAPGKAMFEVFPTMTTGDIPYRIPAIATAGTSGTLVAIADYRYSRADIGSGRIDLHVRRSHDNGVTWDEILAPSVMTGDGNISTPGYQLGAFGDPCIVGDRESDKILAMSCSGYPGFFAGSRTQHQGWARWYSNDAGATWSTPDFVDEQFVYAPLEAGGYNARGWFAGSGRIFQSHYVKKNDYYRLYLAGSTYSTSGTKENWVLYSDDFGQNWTILGGTATSPIPSDADEPKVEELPGGNIVISSRNVSGRYYNIFTFSDKLAATGSWSTKALSSSANNGVTANNGCNGEIMIVPVVRKSDNQKAFLALQSLPRGSGRTNVSIFYKWLDEYEKYDTPVDFAKNWDGYKTVSSIGSAYSSMTWQNDNTIGFIYEEETHCGTGGGGYTIVYKNYSIEEITDSLYTFEVGHDYSKDKAPLAVTAVTPEEGQTGAISKIEITFNETLTAVTAANVTLATGVTAATSISGKKLTLTLDTPITENGSYSFTVPAGLVESADGISSAKTLNYTVLDLTRPYLLYNAHFTTYAIAKDGTSNMWAAGMTGDAGHAIAAGNSDCQTAVNKSDSKTAWMLVNVEGQYYLYNVGADKFVVTGGPTTLTETVTPINVTPLANGAFAFNSTTGGQNFMCVSPQRGGQPICNWTSDDAGSAWILEPSDVAYDYDALVDKILDGMPRSNRFYRLSNTAGGSVKYASNNKYSESESRLAMVDEADEATIWYYTEDHRLIGYATGLGTKNTHTQATMNQTPDPIVFEKSSADGKFYIKRNDNDTSMGRYWYADRAGRVAGSIDAVNRNGSPSGEECNWTVTEVTSLPVSLTQVGDVRYATLYLPMTATISDEAAHVYVATGEQNSKMHMDEILDKVVPAYGGVVLAAPSSTTSVTALLNAPTTSATSVLTGSLVLREAESNEYVFSKKSGVEKVGFYKLPSTITTVKQFRALYVPNDASTAGFDLDFDGTTGVGALLLKSSENVYDLQGRKVMNVKNGNIYIVNGKAVLK